MYNLPTFQLDALVILRVKATENDVTSYPDYCEGVPPLDANDHSQATAQLCEDYSYWARNESSSSPTVVYNENLAIAS